jgi:succinoglycan biosynthesis transport protein ExoP
MENMSNQANLGDNQQPVPQHQALSTNVLYRQAEGDFDEDIIDLKEYWSVIYRRRLFILAIMAAVLLLVLTATLIQTPTYKATSLLQIERESTRVVDFDDVNPAERSGDKDFYTTQYELLKSHSLAERVITDLNLAPQSDPSQQGLLAWVMRLFEDKEVDSFATVEQAGQLKASSDKIDKVNAFLSSLSIEPVRNSRLVKVSFVSPDPVLAARITNTYAQSFISMNLEKRFEANAYAKTFLEDRLLQVKAKLEEAERAQVEYARQNDIFSFDKEGGTTSGQNLQEFNVAMAKAEQERIKAESLYSQINAQSSNLPRELENNLIQQLKSERARIESDYQDKLKTFKPNYPAMQEMTARINEITMQINKEIASVRTAVKSSYEAAQRQESMLRSKLSESKGEVLDQQSRSIQFNILKREADTNRQLYDGLLQRLKEVSVAGGVGANNIMVVDKADIPNNRFKPNIKLNLLIGLLLGTFAGIGLAFFIEYLDDTFKSGDDIERSLGLPLLGIIPDVEGFTSIADVLRHVNDEASRSAMAEAFRSVRTALQFSTSEGAPKVLGITSSHMSEGKSTTSLSLAINFVQCGYSVLLIDADLRKPSLHKAFGIDNKVGLTNHLVGLSPLSEIIYHTKIDQLFFVPTGLLPPNPAELLQGSKMRELIEDAKTKFDLVIFDGPPILGIADALILGNAVDRLLLVIRAGTTERSVVKTALKRLRMARVNPIGCILNKLDHKRLSYGYGYHYSYYAYGTTPNELSWIKRLFRQSK